MNIISANSPRCLLVAFPHVERTLLPALSAAEGSVAVASDFDFDFDFDLDPDSATKLDSFPLPAHTLIPAPSPFPHCSDHPSSARVERTLLSVAVDFDFAF